ncbi:carbon-nitrogen hydrolase family protein [Fodinibius sp.]|uniref:carbon-nitrogen hydrolase family protein n=1 Tax=Fodinibius sp. TaxID=1872440 RepID=UPI002ACE76B5|nr:carbon-nitrogen hydrolase family protein [Fodinibius sp.]MDZ7660194.1 carbon-nitrogen hydrolase family protein [Fodinibius sp.]
MISESYKAAVIQMNSQTDLQANLDSAYLYIEESAEKGAKVVGLPENFSFLGGLSMRMKKADKIAEKVPKFLAETAKEFEIYLMGGSYPVPAGNGKVYNHSPLYTPKGNEKQSYNKIHLFDVDLDDDESYRESDYVQAGDPEAVIYESDQIGNWGLSVCYDLRFPEFYRNLVDNGAEILSIPSAFTYTTGQDHWRPLLRARAIENTSYVFAPAQTGLHGKNRKTWGHAMIIDPWGRVMADAGQEPGIAIAEIDPHTIKQVRSQIPSLNHRRM